MTWDWSAPWTMLVLNAAIVVTALSVDSRGGWLGDKFDPTPDWSAYGS